MTCYRSSTFLITSQGLANELTGLMDENQALRILHERYGCYFVAMTQGARGALAYVEGEFFASHAFRPPVCRDTTGAGDAFRAGFIYGLVKGLSVERRSAQRMVSPHCNAAKSALAPACQMKPNWSSSSQAAS
jgi:sugar/nucleoside kinase (ribokinase family)